MTSPNGSRFDLVIFDCDGVLVDSERLSIQLEVEMFADLGLVVTEDEVIEDFVGRSDDFVRVELSRRLGRELTIGWDAPYADLYWGTLKDQLLAVSGIGPALDQIPLATCVASSGTHEKMRFTLGLTGLYDRFDGRIFSATEVASGKPAPDLFLYAAAQMGVDPPRCAVIEDSAPGVEAGVSAGMTVFGYSGSVTPAEKLESAGATVFAHMSLLPHLLASP